MAKSALTDQEAVNVQQVWLREEIALLERRLDDMGVDGDCAYERAMSKVYTSLVSSRKQQLAALTSPPG